MKITFTGLFLTYVAGVVSKKTYDSLFRNSVTLPQISSDKKIKIACILDPKIFKTKDEYIPVQDLIDLEREAEKVQAGLGDEKTYVVAMNALLNLKKCNIASKKTFEIIDKCNDIVLAKTLQKQVKQASLDGIPYVLVSYCNEAKSLPENVKKHIDNFDMWLVQLENKAQAAVKETQESREIAYNEATKLLSSPQLEITNQKGELDVDDLKKAIEEDQKKWVTLEALNKAIANLLTANNITLLSGGTYTEKMFENMYQEDKESAQALLERIENINAQEEKWPRWSDSKEARFTAQDVREFAEKWNACIKTRFVKGLQENVTDKQKIWETIEPFWESFAASNLQPELKLRQQLLLVFNQTYPLIWIYRKDGYRSNLAIPMLLKLQIKDKDYTDSNKLG